MEMVKKKLQIDEEGQNGAEMREEFETVSFVDGRGLVSCVV